MKRFILFIQLLCMTAVLAHADGGLWTPANISSRMATMRKSGLKLSEKDIYDINKTSLKDEVVGLSVARDKYNFFASGTFISSSGLILTSHDALRSVIKEILSEKDASSVTSFWAKQQGDEKNCKDLCALQLVEMADVTKELLSGTENMTPAQRSDTIERRGKQIVEKYAHGRAVDGLISAFMDQYILSLYHVYRDVRLAGTPGRDFVLLRVYTDTVGKATRYNISNIPLSNNAYAKISATAAKGGDFALTMGFPGRTKWYIPSFSMRYMQQFELPVKTNILRQRIAFINSAINKQPSERAKLSEVLYQLKKSYTEEMGMLDGLNTTPFLSTKEKEEQALTDWIDADAGRSAHYGHIMAQQKTVYDTMIPYKKAELLFNYALRQGSDVVSFIGKFEKLVQMFNRRTPKASAVQQEVKRIKPFVDTFFATYDKEVQSRTFSDILTRYITQVDKSLLSKPMVEALQKCGGDMNGYIDRAFEHSIINSRQHVDDFLANVDSTSIQAFVADPLYAISISYFLVYATRIAPALQKLQGEQIKDYKLYLQALLEKNGNDKLCADGNKTMRLSYGKVTASKDGIFHTDCFTTDGSSGSAVYDAKGWLIGINNGRTSQSAIGDYDEGTARMNSINMDIRNILSVISKQSVFLSKDINRR
jgi:hypothetical protein